MDFFDSIIFMRLNSGDFLYSNSIGAFRIKMSQKVADKFTCDLCDYTCSKKSDLDKHTLTRKHQNRIHRTVFVADQKFTCIQCKKEYTARNSLWYHRKKCNPKNEVAEPVALPPAPVVGTNDQLIVELLTKNKELMEMLLVQTNRNTNNQ
jgi:hypothetical protein